MASTEDLAKEPKHKAGLPKNYESLKEIMRRRIVHGIFRPVNGRNPALFCVLICDSTTLKLISKTLDTSDLVENRIAVVDKLDKAREPLPQMDAIYFLSPTADNFKKLLMDFPDAAKFKNKYRKSHVFLNKTCDDETMEILTKRKDVVKRISTFVELNMDFIARDDRSYYLGYGPNTMLHCFPHRDEYVLKEYCSKLSSVFSTIGDFPLIRFQKDSIDSWCSTLAMALNDELDKYWGDATKEPNKLPCCCLIVDRSIDPVTPFMHDFGMEALAFDLLGGQDDPEKAINMNTDVYSYTGQSGTGEEMAKKVPLNDDLWRSLRHRSVLDAKDMVMEQMQQLQETSEVAKFMAAEAAGEEVEASAKVLREIPGYQEKVAKYGTHLSLATELLKTIQDKQLNKIGALEQMICTGMEGSGAAASTQKMMVALAQYLMDSSLDPEVRTRLILLYFHAMRGLTGQHIGKIIATANLDTFYQNVINEMMKLELVDDLPAEQQPIHTTRVPVEEQVLTRERLLDAAEKPSQNETSAAFNREMFRFMPRLRLILEKVCNDYLDKEWFPYIGNELALEIKLDRKMSGRRPRIVVFMIGGMTYSETRAAFELSRKYNVDIFCGTDSLLSPNQLFNQTNYEGLLSDDEPMVAIPGALDGSASGSGAPSAKSGGESRSSVRGSAVAGSAKGSVKSSVAGSVAGGEDGANVNA